MVLKENRQLREKLKFWLSGVWCPTLFLSVLLFLVPPTAAISQSQVNRDPDTSQLDYVKKLYEHNEYHRSISEILKIKFQYPETSEKRMLDLYLLKNYYQLKKYKLVDTTASEMLSENENFFDKQTRRQPTLIMMTSLLHQGREKRAQHIWEKYVKEDTAAVFPSSNTFPNLTDPNRASFYSGILPGSGFLFSQEYGKAAVSLVLNLIFIAGSYHAFTQQQYGISGLLMFFEISWYFGGKKASAEAARQFNYSHISRMQQVWIQTQLENNGLSDLTRDADE